MTTFCDRERLADLRFDETYKVLEDYAMWLNLLRTKGYGYGNSEILAYYRIRKDSLTALNKLGCIKAQFRLRNKREKVPFLLATVYVFMWAFRGVSKKLV